MFKTNLVNVLFNENTSQKYNMYSISIKCLEMLLVPVKS